MEIETKNFSTAVYFHYDSGDYDTYEGWSDSICGDTDEVDRSIKNGILCICDDEALAMAAFEAACKKGELETDRYRDGQEEVTTGTHGKTGLPIVEHRDIMLLCYTDVVDLGDMSADKTACGEVSYRVTVVFSKEQEANAIGEDGELVGCDLDWDKPYKVIVTEL